MKKFQYIIFGLDLNFILPVILDLILKCPLINSDFQEVGVVRYGYVTYVNVTIIILFLLF